MLKRLEENNFISRKALICIAFCFLLLGLFIRFYNLGKFGFWHDELFHVFAAESILKVGSPNVPEIDGGEHIYTRAYPFTAITALFFKLFGVSETVARIPSVLFNIVFIIIGFFLIRYLFNDILALIYTFVMVFSPFEIYLARECRMYTLFQLLYFVAALCFFIGFEYEENRKNKSRLRLLNEFEKKYNINLFLIFCGGILFFGSLQVHFETFGFAFSLLFYCFILTLYLLLKKGMRAALFSKYFFVLIMGMAGALFIYLLFPDFFTDVLNTGLSAPAWATGQIKNYHAYRYFFLENYPAFVFLYPISMFFMIRNYEKKGLYIFCLFAPLILFHIFLFGRKNARYIFYIYPFFVLGAVYIIENVLLLAKEWLQGMKFTLSKVELFITAFFLLIAVNVFTYPWLKTTLKQMNEPVNINWKSVAPVLQRIPVNSILVSTNTNEIMYYGGRKPDFKLRRVREKIDRKFQILSSDELENLIVKSEDLYLVTNTGHFNNKYVVDEMMHTVIMNKLDPLKHSGDDRIMIFRQKKVHRKS